MVLPQQVITKVEYENAHFQAGSLIPGSEPDRVSYVKLCNIPEQVIAQDYSIYTELTYSLRNI